MTRDLLRQVEATSTGQAPIAAVLSCMDSRAPVELVFDLGLGDVFSIRVAGNIASPKILGSLEYGCGVAGSKLILVLGHTSCGAIGASVDLYENGKNALEVTGCEHLDTIVKDIQNVIPKTDGAPANSGESRVDYLNQISRLNVLRVMKSVRADSKKLGELLERGDVGIVGGLYHLDSGRVEFFDANGAELG